MTFTRETTATRVAAAIREAIVGGKVAPGTALVERSLREALGVSRTTIREALRVLAQDGLVHHDPYRGVTVAQLSEQDVHDLFAARRTLELAGVEASGAPAAAQVERLREAEAAFEAAVGRGDWLAAFDADMALHAGLLAPIPSERLHAFFRATFEELRLGYLVVGGLETEALPRDREDHRAIVQRAGGRRRGALRRARRRPPRRVRAAAAAPDERARRAGAGRARGDHRAGRRARCRAMTAHVAALPALAPRGDFPVLEHLTYLSTASIGLVPQPVQEAARAFDVEIASRGTTWFDEAQETGVLERARNAAARLLGTDADHVAIPSSATESLCQLALWLRPPADSNVVSIDMEFPSVVYPWLRIAEDTGAEVRLVPAMADPAGLSLESVARLVDERTSVICVSHVQFATGCVLDLAGLSELAQAYGAKLVIDATQSAGMVPIDLSAVRVDALVAGGYKWLCGPFGASIMAVHPELLEGLRPPLVGWRSTPDPYSLDARTMPLAPSARRFEFSTMAYTAGQALGGSIEYVLDLGIERILAHDRALADRLIAGLDAVGAEVLTPRDADRHAGTVSARFPGRDGEEVAAALTAAKVIVSPRFGASRFAAHAFNDAADVRPRARRARRRPGAHARRGGGVVIASPTAAAVTVDDVWRAAERLEDVVHRTPVLRSRRLDERAGCELLLKAENLQRTGAFKLRGAYNRIATLPEEQRRRGVVTASSGNHAQGVALAASLLGTTAVVLMPHDAAEPKVAATRAYGAEIVRYDRYEEDLDALTLALARERGLTPVHAFDDPAIVAGQGTAALELLEEHPDLDALVVCVGGGGLISGCATVARALAPDAQVIGVQPEANDAVCRSFAARALERLPVRPSVADGQQVAAPGEVTLPIVLASVDRMANVTEVEIVAAMRTLFETVKTVAEPSGATALAAVLSGRLGLDGLRVGVTISGGNVGAERFAQLVMEAGA